jgi:hypothetical protein
MLSALLPRKQANQTKPDGGRKLLQGDQALRYKSPIQHQENYEDQEKRNTDQNFPVLFIPRHGKSSDCWLPICVSRPGWVNGRARPARAKLSLNFSGFAANRGPSRRRAFAHDKCRDNVMREKTIRWTPEEDEIGRRLLEEDASEAEFLEKLGRTKKAASGHFSYVEHRAMVLRRRRESTHRVTIANAPSIVAMNDEPRQLVAPRSPTSEFFGDPPPGRSALERK